MFPSKDAAIKELEIAGQMNPGLQTKILMMKKRNIDYHYMKKE